MKRTHVIEGSIMIVVAITAALACSGKLPSPGSPSSSCGDQCGSISCPPGSSCMLSPNCAARCEPETLTRPR